MKPLGIQVIDFVTLILIGLVFQLPCVAEETADSTEIAEHTDFNKKVNEP